MNGPIAPMQETQTPAQSPLPPAPQSRAQRITTPTTPETTPDLIEVRDFDLGDGRYVRIVMELDPTPFNQHFHMKAQAFEIDAQGVFIQAPLGYPSRSSSTEHTVIESALGDTIELDDAWCRSTRPYSPLEPDDSVVVSTVVGRPTEPGQNYGDRVWDGSNLWEWVQGWADRVAQTKIDNMKQVVQTSNIRSGLGFRRA